MKVRNKEETIRVINENKAGFKNLGVKKIGLFGSFVRGEQKDSSDIDLLIDFEKGKKTFKNYMALGDFSESILGIGVDLVTFESLGPHIGPHILKEVEYVQISN